VSKENGRWLRAQRQARAWNVPKTAHELRAVAEAAGDNVPAVATMEAHIRRWERGVINPSERYKLYYCKAFGIRADQYGPGNPAGPPAHTPARKIVAPHVPSCPVMPGPALCLAQMARLIAEAISNLVTCRCGDGHIEPAAQDNQDSTDSAETESLIVQRLITDAAFNRGADAAAIGRVTGMTADEVRAVLRDAPPPSVT
jgi:hypothetical protein